MVIGTRILYGFVSGIVHSLNGVLHNGHLTTLPFSQHLVHIQMCLHFIFVNMSAAVKSSFIHTQHWYVSGYDI